jgi:TRAP-type C4-dicarboxylate transport system substrate-binding protein
VTDHHLDLSLGLGAAFMFMNKQAHAGLPEAVRKVIDQYSGEQFSRRMGNATDRSDQNGRTVVGKMPKQTIYTLPPAETAIWTKRVQPVTEDWVKRTPDGARILAVYKAELAKIEGKK